MTDKRVILPGGLKQNYSFIKIKEWQLIPSHATQSTGRSHF